MHRALLSIVATSLSLSACAYARAVPLGPPLAPRPPACGVRFERFRPADAAAHWEQVGAVCVTHGGVGSPTVEDVYESGDMRDVLEEKACGLGGEAVSPVGTCANGKLSGIEFGAYVARR